MCDDNARIRIAAEKAHESRMPEMHAFQGLRSVLPLEQIELNQQGFELGAGEPPLNAAHKTGKMQPARMSRGRLKQTGKARLKIGRAADVRFGAGILTIKSKDGGDCGKLGERGLGIGGIEGERMPRCRRVRSIGMNELRVIRQLRSLLLLPRGARSGRFYFL